MATTTRRQRSKFTALRQRLRRLSKFWELSQVEPEHSVLLRVLVQALVTIGIIATDVAAVDAADAFAVSYWAVPVSALGATWSWYRRRSRNIPVKVCIAIAMLIALAVFFLKLLNEPNDTRLALAELLIQLQVFHSFDLPRRKDLGYSMVIGLILIGVSGTLSQTLAFGPLLVLFLAIAIPALILDYRSRLGLLPQNFKFNKADLAPKRLAVFLLLTVGLGLAIFAVLPRLPGYQLRTFPVSSAIEFDGQFDRRNIINPGYVREGQGTGDLGSGNSPEEGPGELDDNFYYGFNTRINQNLRGELTPQIVMRVRSQSEGFWRVLAFDRYTGQGWEVSRNEESQITNLNRPPWSYRFLIPHQGSLALTREIIQSYTIVSELPNLIPVLPEAKQLYFPTFQLAMDVEGGLRAPVPLSEGLTYTAVSEVPYRDRTQLSQAPTVYPDEIRDHYLQVPGAIAAAVQAETETILANAPNPVTTPYEKALYLAQYLKQNYTLQRDLPFLGQNEDLVDAFLFKQQGGYADHFSTVLTLMLRSIGIPSRLVVGFGTGEFNPFTGFYIVRNTDAYAMTEVYFGRYGWFAFDPIPGHEIIPPGPDETQTFGVLRQFWNWVASWLPSPVAGFLSRLFERITEEIGWAIAQFISLFSRGWLGALAGLGIALGTGILAWVGWLGWQQWRYRRWLGKLPAMESLYQQMLQVLAAQGFRKPLAQTPLEYADHMRQHHAPPQADIVDEISHAYVSWRYGGHPPNLRQLRQKLRELSQKFPTRKFR